MFDAPIIDSGYALAGALTGFAVGLTGVGGGALMTPLLLFFFGVAPTTAIATDLWFAAITKLLAARIHHQGGKVDWQVVKRLWWGSLPTALAVVAFVSMGAKVEKAGWLNSAIGVVLLMTAAGMLLAPKLQDGARRRRITNPERFKAAQPALTVLGGATLGLCVGLTSIGAGALGSVLLMYLYPLRMKPHVLVATDIVHAIPLAVVGGMGYVVTGLVDGHMLLSLLAGSMPAVMLGSQACKRTPSKGLRLMLASVLFAAGLKVII